GQAGVASGNGTRTTYVEKNTLCKSMNYACLRSTMALHGLENSNCVIRRAFASLIVHGAPFLLRLQVAWPIPGHVMEVTEKGERIMFRNTSPDSSRIAHVGLLAGLLALSVPGLTQSVPFPTYTVGPQPNGAFVVSDGTIITPSGTQVNLGIRVRAKAIALNPTRNHTAAVLTMGTSPSNGNGAVEVFNTQIGKVLQSYSYKGTDSTGSNLGIHYTPNGKYLLFSQDSSHVTIASVNATTGLLSDYAQVSVPMAVDSNGNLTTVKCFPNSPPGTTGSSAIPCGQTVSIVSNGSPTSYPTGIAVSSDSKTA